MVELNEKAVEAAINAYDTRHDPSKYATTVQDYGLQESARKRVQMSAAIAAYLSALPAPDDGLEVVAWRWPEPHVEGGALYSVTNVEPPCSGWQGLVLLSDAQAALQSKDEQIERLTHDLTECSHRLRTQIDAVKAAEQQVQKLTAENERLREALAYAAKGLDHVHNGLMDPSRPRQSVGEVCLHFLTAARSALETQEGRE